MFTGGTAVPGTVVSTTQDVQAATDTSVNDVEASIRTAFDALYNETVTVVEGDSNSFTVAKDELEKSLKDQLDWDNVYSEDFKLNVTKVTTNSNGGYSESATISVTKLPTSLVGDEEDKVEFSVQFPVNYITTATIKDQLGTVDLSPVATTENASDIEKVVTAYLNSQLDKKLADTTYSERFEVTNVAKTVITDADDYTEYKITADISNTQTGATASMDPMTLTINKTASTNRADEALAKVIDELDGKTIEVDEITSENAETAVRSEIRKILDKYGYVEDTSNYVWIANNGGITNASLLPNNQWKATIVLGTNVDGTAVTSSPKNLTVTLSKAATTEVARMIIDSEDEYDTEYLKSENVTDIVDYLNKNKKITFVDKNNRVVDYTPTLSYDKTIFKNNKLGTYTITVTDTKSGVHTDLSFAVVKKYTNKDTKVVFADTKTKVTDLSSVSVSDETIATAELTTKNGVINGLELKALKAGTVVLTAMDKSGAVWNTTYIFNADGSIANTPEAKPASDARYFWNDANTIGFVADDMDVTQNPSDYRDGKETVAEVSFDTLADKPVIKIVPKNFGTATIKLTGGDEGKLSTTIKVTYTANDGFKVEKSDPNFDEIKLNAKAIDHLQKDVTYDFATLERRLEGNKNATLTLNVDDLGFDSTHKIVFVNNDNKAGFDTVAASELTKAVLKKEGTAYKLEVNYGAEKYSVDIPAEQQEVRTEINNTVDTLGLVAEDGVISDIKVTSGASKYDDILRAEAVTKADGTKVIAFTLGEDKVTDNAKAEVTITDALGNEASVVVTVKKSGDTYSITAGNPTKFAGYQKYTLTAPTDTVFELGEKVTEFNGYLVSEDKEEKVQLLDEMVTGFTTAQSTVNADDTLGTKTATVNYGGSTGEKFTYTVRPKVENIAVSDLDLADGETVTSVAVRGDENIKASVKDGKIEIVVLKTNISGSVVATTSLGRTVAVKVSVDEDANIETEIAKSFSSSSYILQNNEDTLGLVADSVSSADESIAIASVAGDKIIISSVKTGSTVITATDGENNAYITISVDEFGTVTIENITKFGEDGWVRGEGSDWYYYINGKKVTNDWVAVEEADPYNNNEVGTVWYHFDKDGKMQRGWIKDETGWKIYNLDSNGRMRHDMWINAEANEELGMPTGIYHLLSDGAAQMNGWAESITEGIYWFCAPNSGVFDASNPANWATSMPN